MCINYKENYTHCIKNRIKHIKSALIYYTHMCIIYQFFYTHIHIDYNVNEKPMK